MINFSRDDDEQYISGHGFPSIGTMKGDTMTTDTVNKLKEARLSPRELEVTSLIAQGFSNKMAAKHLRIGEKTVKFHLSSIYRKLNVKTRAQLIVYTLTSTTETA
jgi:DNA-binding NarL/FixJ family response regulator